MCHGNLIFDYVYRLDPAAICSNKWRADFSGQYVGGQAFNAARTLAHLGHTVFFCGTLGLPTHDREKDRRLESIAVDFSMAPRIDCGWQ
jgi:sugar/nucleoside kinase (ribokinase family)